MKSQKDKRREENRTEHNRIRIEGQEDEKFNDDRCKDCSNVGIILRFGRIEDVRLYLDMLGRDNEKTEGY